MTRTDTTFTVTLAPRNVEFFNQREIEWPVTFTGDSARLVFEPDAVDEAFKLEEDRMREMFVFFPWQLAFYWKIKSVEGFHMVPTYRVPFDPLVTKNDRKRTKASALKAPLGEDSAPQAPLQESGGA
jgi:hypothetical protein